MRNRLIELFCEVNKRCAKTKDCSNCVGYEKGAYCKHYLLADHLLAEGVIVPPCKVGQTVYSITECSCEDIDGVHTECEFYGYGIDDRICTIPNGEKCPYQYRVIECYVTETNILMFARMWGKDVFLTREEAEKALERSENGK